jgi:hypothetical protein
VSDSASRAPSTRVAVTGAIAEEAPVTVRCA